jgi:hypothetical protein
MTSKPPVWFSGTLVVLSMLKEASFISLLSRYSNVDFIDGDGNILIPKSVRPIMDLGITMLGEKKGCKKQYRYGNLHIREYESHYSAHLDKVDPRVDPLGHLMVDVPNYLTGLLSIANIAKRYLESTQKI